jgi:hypothetical protein
MFPKLRTTALMSSTVNASLIAASLLVAVVATTTFQAYAQGNERRAVSEIIPISEVLDTTICENGELVQISGNLHLVGRVVFDEDETGMAVQFVGHVNSQNVKGVGLTTGNDYVLTYADNQVLNNSLDGTGSFTQTLTSNLIARGSSESAPDLLVHALFHITVTPNGETTALVDNFNVECR